MRAEDHGGGLAALYGRGRTRALALAGALLLAAAPAFAAPARLTDQLGRSDVRVRSAPFPLAEGLTVTGGRLPERLERLGYRRVHRRPERPGEYFWGRDVFWIYRRGHRWGGKEREPLLLGLTLGAGGRISGVVAADGAALEPGDRRAGLWLEPETLAESFTADRAPRRPVALADLPERVWRPLLAAEDARFFEHGGLDARSIARAALANVLAGGVEQGGSTITQQLIKMRDLTPKRTFGRKLSEAVRALALESEHDKEEILEAYLDHVYYGHVDGVAVYGLGAAARAYFSKDAADLTLGEAALLAAIIQGPNRLSPLRHPDRAVERQRWVLDRLEELGWATDAELAAARARAPALRPTEPPRRTAAAAVRWLGEIAAAAAPERLANGRGLVVESSLDAELQRVAEAAVSDGLTALRRRVPALRGRPLAAALVALDAESGAVLAYVAGDPGAAADRFDRARSARRQPGSAVKPVVLLEALEACGRRDALTLASRVADEPLTVELPTGPWRPVNADGAFHGVVDVRTALARSYNVPFPRIATWCGLSPTAERARRAGLELPAEPPPSFALGAVETTPLRLAEAYTVFATPGRALRPFPASRIERPSGRKITRIRPRSWRVVRPATAWLIRDALRTAVTRGTARGAAIAGVDVAGKTGTSSDGRDAWFAGDAGSLVAVVWVGLDDGSPLGMSGSAAAVPIWREFMTSAVGARAPRALPRPAEVEEASIDPATGLRVRPGRRGAQPELFRRGTLPPRKSFFHPGRRVPVVR